MLLPALYLENFHRKTPVEPERRLMLAVLEDAINCFQANLMAQGKRGKKLFNEAEDWIMEQDNDWMFSFVSICEILRLNPEYVRQGLLQWKQKNTTAQPDAAFSKKDGRYSLAANVQERWVYVRRPAAIPGTDNPIAKERVRKFLASKKIFPGFHC